MMFEVQKYSTKRFNLQNVLNFMNTRSLECADGGERGDGPGGTESGIINIAFS